MEISLAEHIGSDLLSALLDEIKALQKPWQSMSQRNQNEVIDRLRMRIEHNIENVITMIAAQDRPCLIGRVEKVEFKNDVKCILNFSRENPSRHELSDAVGQMVMIIVTENVESYVGGMEDIQGDPDQGELEGVL